MNDYDNDKRPSASGISIEQLSADETRALHTAVAATLQRAYHRGSRSLSATTSVGRG